MRLALGLFALLVMLSSAAWAAGANEDYQADEDAQNSPYAPLDGGAAEDQLWDFAEAWRLAAAEGGVVTLQQDVLAAAEDAPEGIFLQVPEDGQVTLNLNGHRLAGGDVPCLIYVGARGRLTVTDGGQSGGRIVGVIGVDDGADDPDEWGQVELLGDVEVVDPSVMLLDDPEASCTPTGGNFQNGTFEEMWKLAAENGGDVTLLADITAADGSFGTGAGFDAGAIQVPQDVQITLDLNGHILNRGLVENTIPVTLGKGSVILVNGTLNLRDSGGSNGGTITGGKESVRPDSYQKFGGGGINVAGTGILNMSGGTISGNEAYHGGGVYVAGRFTMTGGAITSNLSTDNGGGVYLANGALGTAVALFDMRGGRISNNEVKASTYNTQDCCNGGGVYIEAHDRNDTTYAKFTMSGGEISENTCTSTDDKISGASWSGGGVCVRDNNTFEMTGGRICSNNASGGGGVMVYGTATISNAEISNNTASNGGGIETAGPSYGPKLTLRDTTITGNIAGGKGGGIFHGDAFDVSGTVIIKDNSKRITWPTAKLTDNTDNNVYFDDSDSPICISGALSEDSVIRVVTPSDLSVDKYPLLIAKPADGAAVDLNLKNFVSDDTSGKTFLRQKEDGSIVLETTTGKHFHSLDEGNGYTSKSEPVWFERDLFTALTNSENEDYIFETTDSIQLSSGDYYLSNHLNPLSKTLVVKAGQTVRICLNGHSIVGPASGPAFCVEQGGTLDLCECCVHWKITRVANGDAAVVVNGGTFNLHSGKIDTNATRGVYLSSGTFNMYGGAVSQNTVVASSGAGVYGRDSNFNLYGGEISNNTIRAKGSVLYGGGVYLHGNGAFKMSGGKISGNKIETFENNPSAGARVGSGEGGGVYITDRVVFEMSGGSITGNTAGSAGGVFYGNSSGPMKISGDITITGNRGYSEYLGTNGDYYTSDVVGGTPFEVAAPLGETAQIGFLYGGTWSGNYMVAQPAAGVTLTAADAGKFIHERGASSESPATPALVGGNIVLEGPHRHKLNVGLTGVTAGNTEVPFDKKITADAGGTICINGASKSNNTLDAGSYYLTEDIEISQSIVIAGTVNLCLNGHSITMNSSGKGQF